MNLFAKGKVIQQDADIATIELTEEELGRAVLNYVINNTDGAIGEKFMRNLFSGKPMSLNDMIMENVVQDNSQSVKKNASLNNKVVVENHNSFVDKSMVSNYDNLEDVSKEEMIMQLKAKGNHVVKVLEMKDKCPSVYERIIRSKNGINSQIISNCDIDFVFSNESITYSFINYTKNGQSNVITPNNNIVFAWKDSSRKEIEELFIL